MAQSQWLHEVNQPHGASFAELRDKFPDVHVVHERETIDFQDPVAVRALNRALMAHWFGLDWDVPEDKLCPPIPTRAHYVRWLHNLLRVPLAATAEGVLPPAVPEDGSKVVGVDVGAGATCVYPLIGTALYGWRFLGTELNAESAAFARALVSRNGRAGAIHVLEVPAGAYLSGALAAAERGGALPPGAPVHFTMCNPPFFAPGEEAEGNPRTIKSGADHELATEGGEAAFAARLADDSARLRHRVRWFSTLLGRKATLVPLSRRLRELGFTHTRLHRHRHGRTWRWVAAWSAFPADPTAVVAGRIVESEPLVYLHASQRRLRREAELGATARHDFPCGPLSRAAVVGRALDSMRRQQLLVSRRRPGGDGEGDDDEGDDEGDDEDEEADGQGQRGAPAEEGGGRKRPAPVGGAPGGGESLAKRSRHGDGDGDGDSDSDGDGDSDSDVCWHVERPAVPPQLASALKGGEGAGKRGYEPFSAEVWVARGDGDAGGDSDPEGGGGGGAWEVRVSLVGGDRVSFKTLAEKLESDVRRTSRFWRRLEKRRQAEAAAAGEAQ